MFIKKVLQMISSASKIILPLKIKMASSQTKPNMEFVLNKMWVFGVYRITQTN